MFTSRLGESTIVVVAETAYYRRVQLEPHLLVSVLYTGDRITSFDIHYFSSVITYNHGNLRNLGERDKWYGTTEYTADYPISPFMLDYIRKRLPRLTPQEREFIGHALDRFVESTDE